MGTVGYEFYPEAGLEAALDADPLGTREVRRLLDLAVRSSANGIVITDATLPDNPIIYVNPAFEHITGYSAEEALGRNCRFLQGDDRDQTALSELRMALEEERECRVVLRNYRKDGASFWNELYISPVYDEEGRLVNFVGVQNDVTERKKDEEEKNHLLLREQTAREEAELAKKRLGLLAEVGTMLSASLRFSDTVERVARLMVPKFADWCLVDILEEDGSLKQLAAAHVDPDKEELLRELGKYRELDPNSLRESRRISSAVVDTGEPILVSEITDDLLNENSTDEGHVELLRKLDPRSCILVPLRARSRTLGVITFVSSRKDLRYGSEDLALAEDLAHRCALAVDNARLYEGRSEIARTLQGSLLPARLPDVPGVEVGLRYLPAGEVDVGGDFYDLFEARIEGDTNPSWGVVIGDVCGKGAEAAAVLALARYTIRAIAMRAACPVSILAGLNEAMLRQRHDHKFCTVTNLRLETAVEGGGAKISVSRGGHSAPLVLKAGGSVSRIGHPGHAIGVFEAPNLTEQVTRLAPDDYLLLYTDGVVEARSPDGTFFGEERLSALLRSSIGLDAQALADRVESAVLEFQENGPCDDVAVLVLRVLE